VVVLSNSILLKLKKGRDAANPPVIYTFILLHLYTFYTFNTFYTFIFLHKLIINGIYLDLIIYIHPNFPHQTEPTCPPGPGPCLCIPSHANPLACEPRMRARMRTLECKPRMRTSHASCLYKPAALSPQQIRTNSDFRADRPAKT